MGIITAKNMSIDFPIYGINSRSLKNTIFRSVIGGSLNKMASDRVVVRAINDVSFEFREGDRVGLVGQNGSGKSTLLRAIAGIYEPTNGYITVDGHVASMIDIFLGMDMDATGVENILMRGRIMGLATKKIRSMVEEIAEFSGIGDYLHLPMRTYSSGMAMRLAFSVSTNVESDIILMDEWLSVGDAEFMEKAKDRLGRLLSDAKIVIIASHNYDLVKDQCNRIITLDHGEIIQEM